MPEDTLEILSNEAYIDTGGSVCPVCGSDELVGSSFDGEGSSASQEISCTNCNASWYDEYTLTGFSLIDEGDKYATA